MHSTLYYQRWHWACVKWEGVSRKWRGGGLPTYLEWAFWRGGGVVTLVNGTTRSNTGGYVEHEMGTYPPPAPE